MLGHDRVLGIAAVSIPTGEARGDAEIFRLSPAKPARSVCRAEPRNADPLAEGKAPGSRALYIDHADHFVAGDDGGTVRRKVTFGEMQIGPAHATGGYLHPDLAGARSRDGPFDRFERMGVDRPRLDDGPAAHGPGHRRAAVSGQRGAARSRQEDRRAMARP